MDVKMEDERICRLCLGGNAGVDIFTSALADKIQYTCCVELHLQDGLPTSICQHCVNTLHLTFNFKSQCERSDHILRQQFASLQHPDSLVETQDTDNEDDQLFCVKTELVEGDDCITEEQLANNGPPIPVTNGLPYLVISNNTFANTVQNNPENNREDKTETEWDDDIAADSNLAAKRGHPCHLCGKVLTRKYDLKRHILVVHSKIEDSKCNLCGLKVFDDVQAHLKSHFEEADQHVYECEYCTTVHFDRRSYTLHLRSAVHIVNARDSPDREYKCETCGKVFRHLTLYNYHVKKLCLDQSKCEKCNKMYFNRQKHLRLCSAANAVPVPEPTECDPSVSKEFGPVLQRLETDSELGHSYFCGICTASFPEGRELKSHLEMHPASYKCYFCLKNFPTHNHMVGHVDTVHNKAMCEICKAFVTKGLMKNHLRVHSRVCNLCNKEFSKKLYYLMHCKTRSHLMNVMIVEKKILCPLCDAEFKHIRTYRAHRKKCI